MTYTNSKLVTYTRLSPNHSGQRTHSIDRITPHCVVGQCSAEGLGDWMAQRSTQASCNYGIDKDGRVGMYVEEKNRSWCSSSSANDQRAVTIECASDTKEPYAFRDVVYQTLITLCVDICRRNGKKKLLWLGDKERTLSYSPKSDEMVLTAHRWFANKSCLPVDSEVLTRDGWVKLHDIQIGDEIACADLENLRITFEEVYDKVPERDQDTYSNNGFTATKDHRCVYRCQSQTEYRIDNYNHLLTARKNIYFPLAGYSTNEGLTLTDDEIRLLVAVQADGHYMHELRGGKDTYIGLEFHLKKDRKIQRIMEILDICHYEYTECRKNDGSLSIRVWGKDVVDECEKYLTEKCFNWRWLNLSPHQAKVFLTELLRWDGCTAGNLYTSKQQINLDVVSAIAAINGVGSNVSGSNIQFRQEPYITLGREEGSTHRNNRQHGTLKTRVSCVSVKTGMFLVRQNGKTFITGNCPGDWMMSRMGDLASKVTTQLGGSTGMQALELKGLSEAEVVRRVGALFTADQKRTGILACVSMAQFILESGYANTDLAQNANNCFGMKKVLSGNTWPGSTWDGKSVYTKKTKEDDGTGNLYTENADFRKYPCIEDSIADHSAYLLGALNGSKLRYEGLKGCTNYRKAIQIIKDGGYATDTKYVSKLCSIIERWNLTQYDLVENWYRVRKSWGDEASQIGAFTILANAKAAADANPGYSVFDHNGKKVYTPPTDDDLPDPPFMVKVSTDGTEIYTGPGTNYPKTGQSTGEGIFTIMEISNGPGSFLGWGRLKSGAGWIALDDVKPM